MASVVLGALSILAGQILFALHTPYPPPPRFSADPLLATSLPLFVGGALLTLIGLLQLPLPELAAGEAPPDAGRTSGLHKLTVVFVLLLAFAVRAYRITEMPPPLFDDEANLALDAMKYVNGEFPTLIMTGWGETPAVYTAINSVALRSFGPDVLGARVAGLVFSTATMLTLYAAARALMGPSTALLVMLALALQRWHLIMSRWGANEIVLPFFVSLAFFFTVRGFDLVIGAVTNDPWTRRRPSATAASPTPRRPLWSILAGGFVLGFCMYIYLVSRLVAVGVSLFLIYFVLNAIGRGLRRRSFDGRLLWRRTYAALLYGLAYLTVFGPLAYYYFEHPGVFTSRYKFISLPARMGVGTGTINWSPLWDNIASYAMMLNYTSNEITRHGIPYQPVLNVVCGTLFALGMVLLVRHWWRPANVFCLLWVCLPLVGGALTVSEAPSPYRTIVTSLAVAVVMMIPVYYLSLRIPEGTLWPGPRKLRSTLWAVAAVVLLSSGVWDLYSYWAVLRSNPHLYRHYNYAEYDAAVRIRALAPDDVVYLYPHYFTFSSIELLNRQRKNLHRFSSSEHIPMLQPRDVDTHIFLPLPSQDLIQELRLFHPHLTAVAYEPPQVPGDGHYEVVVPSRDLEDARGVWVSGADGARSHARAFDFPGVSGSRAQDVTWEAVLDAPQVGAYKFSVHSTQPLKDRCELTVAGQPVANAEQELTLLAGRASLRLKLRAMQANERIELQWRRPDADWESVPANRLYAFQSAPSLGLVGTYYPNMTLEGTPFMEREDLIPAVSESMPSPHSVRWTGLIDIPRDGFYTFTTKSDDGARLFLDGVLLINRWEINADVGGPAGVTLHKGLHPLQIDYFDQGGGRSFRLSWTTPDGRTDEVPFEAYSHAPRQVRTIPFREEQ